MKNLISPVLIAIGFFSLAAAQTNQEFIHGKWRLNGQTAGVNGGHGGSWFQEWTFGDGTFLENGYPPLSQKGKYRVLKDEDTKLTLELYEQSGDLGNKNSTLAIVIDRTENTLKIGQNAGFKRK